MFVVQIKQVDTNVCIEELMGQKLLTDEEIE
jgi:hypothetical protein